MSVITENQFECNTHAQLVSQFEEANNRPGFFTKDLILEILLVATVCGMKMAQTKVPLSLNVIATTFVSMLLFWYFCDFNYKRSLDKSLVDVALKGLKLEEDKPFSGQPFFKQKIKKFSILEKIVWAAIFDFTFIYFFSVSLTQTLKAIDPEIVAKLVSTTKLRTIFISGCLVYFYYRPFKPIREAQQKLIQTSSGP